MTASADQIRPGALLVTREVIEKYAAITNDRNPIHLDAEFAAKTSMGGIIAHGTMSLALIWQVLRAEFGAERCAKAEINIRFTKSVRIGDQLHAQVTAGPEGTCNVWVKNQADDKVIDGVVEL